MFLLSALAFQRFLIFFFPSAEKYVTFKDLKHFVRFLYGFFVVFDFLIYSDIIGMFNYILFDIFLFVSALLYIPIVYSIRAVRYLPSIQANQPQRYVIWQLASIAFFKLFYTFYFVITETNIDLTVLYCKIIDLLSVSFIIQISYLGCNRRTMITVFQSLKCGSFWKTCCCPCIETTRVEQAMELAESTGLPLY